MKPMSLIVSLVALLTVAPSDAAVVARIALPGSSLTLRAERGVLIARRSELAGDAWRLVFAPSGPLLDLTAPPRCDVQIWAAADTSDPAVAATVAIAATRDSGSLLVAVRIDFAGQPSVSWSHDWASLPALGRLAGAPSLVRWQPGGPLEVLLGNGWPREETADATTTAGALLRLDARNGQPHESPWSDEAALPGEVTALDGDADGAVDRLYLADAANRLWRLDVPATLPGAPVRVRPLMLAALGGGVPPEAAFIHAPDVALAASDEFPSFSVAIASSDRPRRHSARHALVVARDPFVRAPPTDRERAAYRPTSWDELADVNAGAAQALASPGYRLALDAPATGPALTVGGKVRVATGVTPPCAVDVEWPPVPLTIHALPIAPGPLGPVRDERIQTTAAPDARLDLDWSTPGDDRADAARCTLDGRVLDDCGLGPRVTRRYWLRRDSP